MRAHFYDVSTLPEPTLNNQDVGTNSIGGTESAVYHLVSAGCGRVR